MFSVCSSFSRKSSVLTTDRRPLPCPWAPCVPLFLLQPHSHRRSAAGAWSVLSPPGPQLALSPLGLAGALQALGLSSGPGRWTRPRQPRQASYLPSPLPQVPGCVRGHAGQSSVQAPGGWGGCSVVSRDLCRPLTRPCSAWGTSDSTWRSQLL